MKSKTTSDTLTTIHFSHPGPLFAEHVHATQVILVGYLLDTRRLSHTVDPEIPTYMISTSNFTEHELGLLISSCEVTLCVIFTANTRGRRQPKVAVLGKRLMTLGPGALNGGGTWNSSSVGESSVLQGSAHHDMCVIRIPAPYSSAWEFGCWFS